LGALGPGDFARLISPFAPFEPNPVVAVAVSGGADSMALTLLAAQWASARKGRAIALTVDHGLRPESGPEARSVGRWLRARGIAHRILTWTGPKPRTGIQAAAREARYRLLRGWCRRHHVLHVLVAHTIEDQAETFLLRLERGSGVDGLAGMPAVTEGPQLRLLRPLLTVPKARLIATLRARHQEWIEDPSNRDESFARVRIRAMLSGPAATASGRRHISAAARAMGAARSANEQAVAECLTRAASPHPAGYIELDAGALSAAPPHVAARALTRCLMAVSGAQYAPRGEKLARLLGDVMGRNAFRARTLGGCRIVPHGGRIMICREWAKAESCAAPVAGEPVLWDRRFLVRLKPKRGRAARCRLGPLGEKGWNEVVKYAPGLRHCGVPAAVRPSLPALFDRQGVFAVPHLGFARSKTAAAALAMVTWQPANPLTGAGFSVA
jgi:tRNA(Ile)-lysidine synthase